MKLYEKLTGYGESDILPMHMPGHKRQAQFGGCLPYSIDITEIDGFDNLHHREGILKELCDYMAELRHSEYAIPVVGGSTVGILSSVWALTSPGDTVILSRACHKSVYHAIEIRGLKPVYIYPETDEKCGFFLSVEPWQIEEAFANNKGAKLVILTSPTYEGAVSDIKAISEIVHENGALLLVDAAHGAHLGYSCSFPADAISRGADVSVESLHKTLPAMTQTAAIYLGENVDASAFERALDIFETSSPSYVLLSSIDRCISLLGEKAGEIFAAYRRNINIFNEKISCLSVLSVPGHTREINAFGYDDGKIVISTENVSLTGPELTEILRKKYKIEPEMTCRDYVLCMTSICDNDQTFSRLAQAIIEIDSELSKRENEEKKCVSYPALRSAMSVSEALKCKRESCVLSQSSGRISMTYLWAYPPGIPIVAPGEIISEEVLDLIAKMKKSGVEVQAPGYESVDVITVKTETEK